MYQFLLKRLFDHILVLVCSTSPVGTPIDFLSVKSVSSVHGSGTPVSYRVYVPWRCTRYTDLVSISLPFIVLTKTPLFPSHLLRPGYLVRFLELTVKPTILFSSLQNSSLYCIILSKICSFYSVLKEDQINKYKICTEWDSTSTSRQRISTK